VKTEKTGLQCNQYVPPRSRVGKKVLTEALGKYTEDGANLTFEEEIYYGNFARHS